MEYTVQNLSDNLETKINFDRSFKTISFTNIDPLVLPVNIDLYVKDLTGTILFYILRNTQIPSGTALELSEDEISYLNIQRFLYIKSYTITGEITIIIKR